MRNKRFLAMALAAVSMMSLFNGCDSDKEAAADKTGKESSSSVSSEEDKPLSDNISIMDKVYRDYLEQQKLCTISKGFEILEPGVARDNPNGLAGAVKYDFDGDKKDELVTFTFERNNTNGEDIRIDLLKVNDDGMKVVDSKYLTEILDMGSIKDSYNMNLTDGSIYFTQDMSMQIVSSEYQDKLYFGGLITYENFEREGLDTNSHVKTFSVFGIDDDKIVPCSVGAFDLEISFYKADPTKEGVLYASVLPPSLKDKIEPSECKVLKCEDEYDMDDANSIIQEIDDMTVNADKYNLFTSIKSHLVGTLDITGGEYSSPASAFSAMLNEFGLDIEYNTQNDNVGFAVKFVSKNQSDVKDIVKIEALKDYDGYYSSNRLTLSSDLEALLGDDAIFTEPFADEEELYNDIFRYPHYYRDVWDKFGEIKKSMEISDENSTIEYFSADINNDGKKELVITIRESSYGSQQLIKYVSVVKPDLTIVSAETDGAEIEIYDNGVICVSKYYTTEGMCYIDTNSGDIYTGEEAATKKSELSATALHPEWESGFYNLYMPQNFSGLNFIEDIEEIKFGWEEAYIDVIDSISEEDNVRKDGISCRLLYINNDDIPELFVEYAGSAFAINLYKYENGKVECIFSGGSRQALEGYTEKKGKYFDYGIDSNGGEGYSLWDFEKNEKLGHIYTEYVDEEQFYIDDEEVSEEEFNKKLAEYKQGMISPYDNNGYTYDEIIKILNGEEVEKPAEDNNSSDSKKAKVKADGGLNMRSGAGKEFDKVTLIPDGSEVEILEKQSEWTKVKYKDYTGWVSNEFLK